MPGSFGFGLGGPCSRADSRALRIQFLRAEYPCPYPGPANCEETPATRFQPNFSAALLSAPLTPRRSAGLLEPATAPAAHCASSRSILSQGSPTISSSIASQVSPLSCRVPSGYSVI